MGQYTKAQAISIVVNCAEQYRENLANKNLLFICQDKHQKITAVRMSDELMLSTFGAIAQEESVATSQRVKRMNRERMKLGEYVASTTPYGYLACSSGVKYLPFRIMFSNRARTLCQFSSTSAHSGFCSLMPLPLLSRHPRPDTA